MTALVFEQPLPGLAPFTDYRLDAVEGAAGVFSLRPEGVEGVRLFVLDAATYVPSYAPEVSVPSSTIGLGPDDRPRILVVATPGAGGTSVNLAAPVLVNEAEGRAVQAVLDNQDLRAPLSA